MNRRDLACGLFGGLIGIGVSGVGWAVLRAPEKKMTAEPRTSQSAGKEDETLAEANANLVASLHQCDIELANLRSQLEKAPVATAAPQPSPSSPGRGDFRDRDAGGRRRFGGEPTSEDWERMAKQGALRVQVPCLRDKPWTPSARVLDRLGLAPGDGETIREAYEHSNKRVLDQVRPLCAKVLGSADMVDKVGASTCMDAIVNSARRGNPEATKQSLTRVAEVNGGKREAPKASAESPAVEQLLLALSGENKAFEAELAQKLGPEEAKRLAWAPEMCTDRKTVRASDERPDEPPPGR